MTNRHVPALLGGLFIGVMSSLPVVQMCCCLWAVCGGMLVTYLQQQRTPNPIETTDGALGGLLAGLIGATIASIVPMVLFSMGGISLEDAVREFFSQNDQMPPEWRDRALGFVGSGRNIALLMFLFNVPMYSVLSLLGSLLGIAFFRKKTPPPEATPQA